MKKIKWLALNILPESFLLKFKKIYYVRSLKKFSEMNEPDLAIVKLIVKPGDHVIDIGANIGWYTKILSDLVGSQGRVYSIEPLPPVFELLSFCVKKLNLRNVELLNCAISEEDGLAMMEVPKYENGGDNFYRSKIVDGENLDPSLRHYKVNLKSLDSLFSALSERISFIKCDVEGHELQVIKGGRKVISNFRPGWLVEISGNPTNKESNSFEVFTRFEKERYGAWWFNGKQLRKYYPGDNPINCFFLTDCHISSMLGGIGLAL